MKKGIVVSIDVFLASIIVIIFISSFIFYSIRDNIEDKIVTDRALDTLVLLEKDFIAKDRSSIGDKIEDYMGGERSYQLVIDYYNTQNSLVDSIIVGSDLNEVLSVSRLSFVIMNDDSVSEFGIASLKVGS